MLLVHGKPSQSVVPPFRCQGDPRAELRVPSMDKLDKKVHINFWYIIAAVLGMLLIQDLYIESTKLTPIPYSRFQTLLDEDKIDKIAIGQNYISGSLKEPAPDGLRSSSRRASIPTSPKP